MNTTKEDLIGFLQILDRHMDKKVTLVAVGGTALTLLGIKDSTKDVDIEIPKNRDFELIESILKDFNFRKEGISWYPTTNIGLGRIDLFKEGYIFSIQLLNDYLAKAKPISEIGKITLKALDFPDIIITKLGRGDERDFDDIKKIYESKEINNAELIERYFETSKSAPETFTEMIRQRLLDLVEVKFRQWGLKHNKELVRKVKKWKL